MEYKTLINKALKTMTPLDLSVLLKTSVPTVRRWASGKVVPHDLIKEAIVRTLTKKLVD